MNKLKVITAGKILVGGISEAGRDFLDIVHNWNIRACRSFFLSHRQTRRAFHKLQCVGNRYNGTMIGIYGNATCLKVF